MEEINLSFGDFNHCSSICHYNNGIFVASYAGTQECAVDQSVYLTYIQDGVQLDTIRIGDGTGNPVIWTDSETIILLYSKFEFNDKISTLVDKWKYCSLWLQRFTFSNRKIYWSSIPIKLADESLHLLGRCRPLNYSNKYFLPLYNESGRYNVIYEGNGTEYSYLSSYGNYCIQPTLWLASGVINSISRNFGSPYKYARHHSSPTGSLWSEQKELGIYNVNHSIHAFAYKDVNYILWNDSKNHNRNNLTLGIINNDLSVTKLLEINKSYGSYPSVSVDDTSIIITYTNARRKISVRGITEREIDTWQNRSDSGHTRFEYQKKESPAIL